MIWFFKTSKILSCLKVSKELNQIKSDKLLRMTITRAFIMKRDSRAKMVVKSMKPMKRPTTRKEISLTLLDHLTIGTSSKMAHRISKSSMF